MIERSVTIVNSQGFHARPAAQFVKLAATFRSEIELTNEDETVNGKSIMGVMMLAAQFGATVQIRAIGDDEAAAADALCELVSRGFGER